MRIYVLHREMEDCGCDNYSFVASDRDLSDEDLVRLSDEWRTESQRLGDLWLEEMRRNSQLVVDHKEAYQREHYQPLYDLSDEELAREIPDEWRDAFTRNMSGLRDRYREEIRQVSVRQLVRARWDEEFGGERHEMLAGLGIDDSEEERLGVEYRLSLLEHGPLRRVMPRTVNANPPWTNGAVELVEELHATSKQTSKG